MPEAKPIKPVNYGILYYRRRWLYYFSSIPSAKVAIQFSAAGAKLLLCARSQEKGISGHIQPDIGHIFMNNHKN